MEKLQKQHLAAEKTGRAGSLYVVSGKDGLTFRAKMHFGGISVGSLDANGELQIDWNTIEKARLLAVT
jgi:hypothetical protein